MTMKMVLSNHNIHNKNILNHSQVHDNKRIIHSTNVISMFHLHYIFIAGFLVILKLTTLPFYFPLVSQKLFV